MALNEQQIMARRHNAISRWHPPGAPEVIAARRALILATIAAKRAEVARLQAELDEMPVAS